ncbi:MAG: peroxiredoxin-like family protein [Myxococcota bacterium]|nr:peroxiredoxin-like family protein [Myxococcota bacterium]
MTIQLQQGDKAADFVYDTPWETGQNFYASAGKKTAVLVFLRYLGCPVCQVEMANLKLEISLFEEKGVQLFVFLQSSPDTIAASASQADWPFTIVCDPQEEIFQLYRVAPGGVLKYLHPAGLLATINATVKGVRHGKFEGRETQLPAVFVVGPDKTIQWVYYGKTLSDVPVPAAIVEKIAG